MRQLQKDGFTVIHELVGPRSLRELRDLYDEAFETALPSDLKQGSTSIRLGGFAERGSPFDAIYSSPTLISITAEVIGRAFKLSSFHGRTVRPRVPAQRLHQDIVAAGEDEWPMVGFIFMIDDFRTDNGATRFLPGSQSFKDGQLRDGQRLVSAQGKAGSLIIFNGSVWHGHGPNDTLSPRRSLQGAFIRSDQKSAGDFSYLGMKWR